MVSHLSSQHIFQSKGITNSAEEQQKILNKLNNTKININVTLGTSEINVRELMDLKVGDVLKLDNSVNDNLIISIHEKPKFLGRPGIKRNNIAISIVNAIEDKELE